MTSASLWSPPPPQLHLSLGQVHVWRCDLEAATAQIDALAALLSAEEAQKGARFVFERHRQRYIVGRGVLRRLLGMYVGTDPRAVEFDYGPQGKPRLRGATPLRFNVSHSHTLALLAFALERDLGVDVEQIRTNVAEERIAERFFAPREVAVLEELPPSQVAAGFFNCWTRKEAYIKALGKGLSQALDSFAVELRPDQPAALLWAAAGEEERQRWRLAALEPGTGYKGALCVEGHDWQYSGWQWEH